MSSDTEIKYLYKFYNKRYDKFYYLIDDHSELVLHESCITLEDFQDFYGQQDRDWETCINI